MQETGAEDGRNTLIRSPTGHKNLAMSGHMPCKRIYLNLAMSKYYLVELSPIKRREIKLQYLNVIPYKGIYSNLAMSGYNLTLPTKEGRSKLNI